MSLPRRIYLDNAATSWPKPPAVYEAVARAMRDLGAPAGRGTYWEASEVERLVAETRRQIAELIGAEDPRHVIFTFNGTDSLNLALHGILRPGDHVVTTDAEHNSVLRPLRFLEEHRQVTVTYIGCDRIGLVDPDQVRKAITSKTRLIAMVHASNVTGAIQPAEAIGQIAAEHELRYLVDAAQSLGHLDVDVRPLRAHLVAAPGHKGLLGPLGTGLLYVAPGVEGSLLPFRQGGTGTQSESDNQPATLPDRFEAGNHNVPGLIGLGAGVKHVRHVGLASLAGHQRQLTQRLLDGLGSIPGVTVYGPEDAERQIGVISFRLADADPQDVASMLDSAFGIQVRAGLHCAPRMHRSLGTADSGGTVRISVGTFNTLEEVDLAIAAIGSIAASI